MLALGSCKVDKDSGLCPQCQAGIRQNRRKRNEPFYWSTVSGSLFDVGILDPAVASVLRLFLFPRGLYRLLRVGVEHVQPSTYALCLVFKQFKSFGKLGQAVKIKIG